MIKFGPDRIFKSWECENCYWPKGLFAYGVYLHACPRSELMIFTALLGLAAAVDMHQKVTPVQKVPATEHGLIEP